MSNDTHDQGLSQGPQDHVGKPVGTPGEQLNRQPSPTTEGQGNASATVQSDAGATAERSGTIIGGGGRAASGGTEVGSASAASIRESGGRASGGGSDVGGGRATDGTSDQGGG